MTDVLSSQYAYLRGVNEIRADQVFGYAEYTYDQRNVDQVFGYAEYTYDERRADQVFAYIEYIEGATSEQPGYLSGAYSANHAQAAYLAGSEDTKASLPSFLSGQVSAQGSQPSYLEGVGPLARGSQPAYLAADILTTSSLSAFLLCASAEPAISWTELEVPTPPESASGSVPAYLQGLDQGASSQHGFLAGSTPDLSSVPGYLSGSQGTSDNQSAYLAGNILATGETSAYLEGYSATGPASSSQDAYTAGGTAASASVHAYTQGGTGTFPIQVGDAWSHYYGSALITNSFGVKYAVTKASSSMTILIYRDINGFPKLVASQSAVTVGNNSQWLDARIDGNDCIHIISHGGTPDASLDIAYRVFDTRNDTWIGSWEQAATLYAEIFDNWSIRIAIDSNNKPHVVYVDPVTGTYPNVKYIEKTGASWSSPVTLSEHASDSYKVYGITMLDGDDIDVFYFDDTLNDACYIQKIGGSWGSETVWVGTFMEPLSGVWQVVDGDGNIYRYHATDVGNYALLYENNVSTGVQVADLDPWLSACILSSMPGVRCVVYRNDNGAIWLATYNGSWSSRVINSTVGMGGWTEWAYNYENEHSLVGYIYTYVNKLYYDEVTPIIYSSKHAYTEGYQPKSSAHAYLSGWAHPTSSAHAYMFCGAAEKSGVSAFTNGAATQGSLHAYLEGLEYSSPLSAYLYGSVGSDTPAYLQSIVVLTDVEPAYTFGWSHVLDSNPAFLFGNIAPSSSRAAFTQGITSTPWSSHAFLQGIEANHLPSYLEGRAVPRDYVRVRNGEQTFQFKVLAEGFSDGDLLPSVSLARTIPGGLDISTGGKYRQWQPTLRLRYSDIADLETLYASTETWVYEDHFGMEHNVVLVGSWRKSIVSAIIEGDNSLFLVRVTFVEVL